MNTALFSVKDLSYLPMPLLWVQ